MKETLLLILVLICVAHVNCVHKLEKLSLEQSVEALRLINAYDRSPSETIKQQFLKLTGCDLDVNLKDTLLQVVLDNGNQTSWFMKMVGLISFQNIIIVCMIFVGIALVFFLAYNFIALLGETCGMLILQIILRKDVWYGIGMTLGIFNMLIDPSNFNNHIIRYVFIFDWLTPLFGCILFGITSFLMYDDLIKDKNVTNELKSESRHVIPGCINTIIFATVALLHNNWLIGVLTIIMLFYTYGFLFGSTFMGYYVGFTGKNTIVKSLMLSILLNSIVFGFQQNFITGDIGKYVVIFSTGVQFWGTFIGCLAMLILADENYMTISGMNALVCVLMQIVAAIYYLGMMYIGSIAYISPYKSIAGTFMVLWGIDLERMILSKLGNRNMTLTLIIVLANLYLIKQLIGMHPEYFII